MTSQQPIEIWRTKREHLLCEEAIASDAAVRFQSGKQIEEAEARIDKLKTSPALPKASKRTRRPDGRVTEYPFEQAVTV